ncbi:MAG TPA: PQQ-dependent sugar dehydrogenase [Gammaproteobacteria bacterium]
MRPATFSVMLALAAAGCHGGGGGDSSPGTTPPSVNPPVTPPAGLDARPTNATCVAPPRTGPGAAVVALERVFANLSFDQPLGMLQAPGDDSRWFVLQKGGAVRVFENRPDVDTAATFVSVNVDAASEGGLLGMAFHPSFASNGTVFLSYTVQGSPMVSVVARYTSSDGGATLDPNPVHEVIRVNQPFENHNGGHIAFGPDGYLYLGLGDGGSGGDPDGRAQDTTDLLGDFLRLDVDRSTPYTIPPDNPFAGNARCGADTNVSMNDCPEIYAWGFRNPWRWSFDSLMGDLWVGDVGQGAFEEVDTVERGGNYGWDCREGGHPYSSPAPSCSTATGLIDPVHEYGRTEGNSITGGYVYRGTAIPALAGSYVFGDFGSGRIWRLVPDGAGGYDVEALLDTNLAIASFAQANDGELYVVDLNGTLHKIVDAGSAPPTGIPVPELLSATGCVNPQRPSEPAAGLVPYDVAAPFWSDGADEERWLAIPDGTVIGVGADGDFAFPNGAVLMQHFRLNGALVETRLFMRHPDGVWAGYSYEWNAAQTDASLAQGGKTVTVGQQEWIFPSGNECLACHTAAAGFALGLETAQLNHDFAYASTGRTANQLLTLDRIALFASPLNDPAAHPRLPDPFDAAAPLGERARAYLHANCAHCHRPNGPTPSTMDLRYGTPLDATGACDALPQAGDLGLGAAARIIAPGRPADSVLPARMGRRDANGMPPLASRVVDAAGVALIEEWIAGLAGCL